MRLILILRLTFRLKAARLCFAFSRRLVAIGAWLGVVGADVLKRYQR
jgi:hypothetical protein